MKGSVITIAIVLAALVVVGLLIFSGNNQQEIPEDNQGQNNSGQTETQEPLTYTVEIADFSFNSELLEVRVGDTVVWTNRDNTRHTVTSDAGIELDSELLSKGTSYSHTFTSVGTYRYHCTPHPSMRGTVIVR